jgi:hypothetical protein
MRLRNASALLALILAAGVASDFSVSASGDKAGGRASGPVMLRMASASSGVSEPRR